MNFIFAKRPFLSVIPKMHVWQGVVHWTRMIHWESWLNFRGCLLADWTLPSDVDICFWKCLLRENVYPIQRKNINIDKLVPFNCQCPIKVHTTRAASCRLRILPPSSCEDCNLREAAPEKRFILTNNNATTWETSTSSVLSGGWVGVEARMWDASYSYATDYVHTVPFSACIFRPASHSHRSPISFYLSVGASKGARNETWLALEIWNSGTIQ